jgi:hypothetical protein
MIDIEGFEASMQGRGWHIFPSALTNAQVIQLREDCLRWLDICARYQVALGIAAGGDGTAHHAIGGGDSIDAFIDMHILHPYLDIYFSGKPYILHSCNPVGGLPNTDSYIHRVHRDTATYIPNYNLRMNMLVMLDDFTIENGATKILSGSHSMAEKPSDEYFDRHSESIVGASGSIVLFNSYLWHRGGANVTSEKRVALTLSFGPAFIKPQMDYARLLGEAKGAGLSPLSRQVLGFNSRVPTSLDEWYKPKAERLYWADQG